MNGALHRGLVRRWLGVVLATLCCAAAPVREAIAAAPPGQIARVSPEAAARIAVAGVVLEIDAGSVAEPTDIEVIALDEAEVAGLDPGMANVTAGDGRGYRFNPSGARFRKPLRLSLLYDELLLPAGTTEQDIRAFYFDEPAMRWRQLEYLRVVKGTRTVVSLTDHFTDIILATVTVPDHPGVQSAAPTAMMDMKAADPAQGLALIQPPRPNPLGEARLSLPIEVPPGRAGMQPELALQYLSQAGNGWLGLGWTLEAPGLTVDTRWGVPRYGRLPDASGTVAYRDKETESYVMDGLELTPVANRATFADRIGSEKVFHARVEGDFDRIIRHGDHPARFWWEVTDREGVTWTYGDPPSATAGSATLRDSAGNVFRWALREARDPHGNAMRFEYQLVEDPGIVGGTAPGRQLYLAAIDYTGRGSGAGDYEPGIYTVRFIRDSDPSVAPWTKRRDVQIDCRGGFKQVTAELLREIRVELDGRIVRAYDLVYETGGFGVTRLAAVRRRGADGEAFPGSEHRFAYYDDVRETGGAYPDGFAPESSWTVPADDVTLCTDLGVVDVCPSLFAPGYDQASLLGGANTQSIGGHAYIGLNCGEPTKEGSAGFKVGYTYSSTDTRLALLDVNGDNLPDKVMRSGDGFVYRENEASPGGAHAFSATTTPLTGVGAIGTETSDTWAGGAEAYPLGTCEIFDASGTSTVGSAYSTDANGDGLVDFVQDGQILFSHLDVDGHPTFETTSDNTPLPLAPGVVDGGSLIKDYDPLFQDLVDRSPLLDVFRRWLAPWDGEIRILGDVRLAAPSLSADGVRVSIQRNGEVLWAAVIPAGDDGVRVPAGVSRLAVRRGDRIYFRVQSLFDGTEDAVAWDPELQYLDVPPAPDANGLDACRYLASEDYVLAGRSGRARVPYSGTVRFTGTFEKRGRTSDDVAVSVRRDGVELFRVGMPWDSAGTVAFDSLFTVTGDDTTTRQVDEADLVHVRLVAESPIDAALVGWQVDAPPTLTYETIAGSPVPVRPGVPPVRIVLPSDLDLYPASDLIAPQEAWVAPDSGTISAVVAFLGTWSFRDPLADSPVMDGQLAFTIKRAGGLLARGTVPVQDGAARKTTVGGIRVARGDRVFFDLSMRDPQQAGLYSVAVVYDSLTAPGGLVPCALHTTVAFDDVTTLGRGLFPQPYRGWGCAGYNGNPARGSAERPQACVTPRPVPTAAIVESDLVLDGTRPTVAGQKSYPFSPVYEELRDRTARACWRGPDESAWVQAGQTSSSRLGLDAVGVPCPSDLAAGARAVPRIGGSTNIGGGAGFWVAITASGGANANEVDFLDLNGDGFPDPVGNGVAQYTLPDGGLESVSRVLASVDTVRSASNNAWSVSLGGTVPNSKGNAKGKGGASSKSAPAGERVENLMVSLGFSGDLGSGSSENLADLVDMNGDGLPDRVYDDGRVALSLGYGFAAPENWPGWTGLDESSSTEFTLAGGLGFNDLIYGFAGGLSYSRAASTTSQTLLDLNGDGLPDRLRESGGTLYAAFNLGNGFGTETRWQGAALTDGVASSANASLGTGVFFTVGIPIFLCSPVTVLYLIVNPGGMAATGMARQETALLDMDGDGCADYVRSSRDDELSVARNRAGRTNLLRRVERPLGGSLTLDYARRGNVPDMPQSLWTLSSVLADDGVADDGPPLLTTFSYAAPRYDRGEREFYGFGTIVEADRAAEAPAAARRVVERTFRNDSYYSRGLLVSETTRDADGRPLRGADFGYEFRDVATGAPATSLASRTASIFPMLVRSENRLVEGGADPGLRSRRLFEYDAAGQVVRVEDSGNADPGDDQQTAITYADCPQSHVLDRANAIVVRGGGVTLAERYATVDPGTGDVLQVRERLADGGEAVTDLAYRPDGMLRGVTGPANLHGQRIELRYEYDPRIGTHVVRAEDCFGLASTAAYDLRFGRPVSTTDANGSVVTYAYDAFGRVTAATGPYEQGTGEPSLRFEYHPEAAVPWARSRHRDVLRGPSDPIETILFGDGLGRLVQAKVDGTIHFSPTAAPRDVMIVSGRTRYDDLGRPAVQYQPVVEPLGRGAQFNAAFDPVTPGRIEYDALDRPTAFIQPNGSTTRYAYALAPDRGGALRSETTVTDANGNRRWIYRDAQDAVVAVREGAAGSIWTSYRYDPLGRLVGITDAQGNETRMTYDQLGRRTRLVRPDAGETQSEYDLASNLVALRTANLLAGGTAIRYDYDFTRLREVRHPGEPDVPVLYEYGGPGAGDFAAGRVTRITDGTGVEERSYGRLGEMVRQARTIIGHAGWNDVSPVTYTTKYDYDTWGRLLGITYPDGEALAYGYDAGGLVRHASGTLGGRTYEYLRRLEYDKARQPAYLETGNGVQTSFEYRPLDQRLDRVRSVSAAAGAFQDLRFTYDPVGNVLSLANDVRVPPASAIGGPTSQTFEYDDLGRLVAAAGTHRFAPNKTSEYTLALRYDAIYDILERRQTHDIVQPSGKRVPQRRTTYALLYDYASARPHAAVHAGDRTYTYDANGNQTGWTDDRDGTRQRIVWDDEDRARSIFQQGHELQYAYDAAGARVLERGPQGEVVTVNPFFSVRNRALATKHFYVGTMRLATRPAWPAGSGAGKKASPNEGHIFFYHPDQLGSTQFVTNEDGVVAQHLEYFPFGETWVEESKGPDRAGVLYSGQEQDDETGLYWFGARYHDPRLGRFLSVDAASAADGERIAAANPATLNSYVFALDSPVRLVESSVGPTWWSGWWHTLACLQGVGGRALAGTGAPSAVPQMLGATDSPVSAGMASVAGDFLADAGVGAIATMPAPEARIGRNQAKSRTMKGPDRDSQGRKRAGATRARSDAVVGEGPAANLDGPAPVVIGENVAGRVVPYARSIGAETVADFLDGRKWSGQLNDQFIAQIKSRGRQVIDIGPDFAQRLRLRGAATDRAAYEADRQAMRGYARYRGVFSRTGKASGGVPGLDQPGRFGGAAGIQP